MWRKKMEKFDVVVVGGSIGGVLSAYSLAKRNHQVLLIEETDWIGGQFTSQGVPSDEHDFIEETGITQTYRKFREDARDYYRNHENIIDELKDAKIFNPGNGWVSKNSFEPKLALKLFNELLNPFVEKGNLNIWLDSKVIESKYTKEKVQNILVNNNGEIMTVEAKYFIDATDNGDL